MDDANEIMSSIKHIMNNDNLIKTYCYFSSIEKCQSVSNDTDFNNNIFKNDSIKNILNKLKKHFDKNIFCVKKFVDKYVKKINNNIKIFNNIKKQYHNEPALIANYFIDLFYDYAINKNNKVYNEYEILIDGILADSKNSSYLNILANIIKNINIFKGLKKYLSNANNVEDGKNIYENLNAFFKFLYGIKD